MDDVSGVSAWRTAPTDFPAHWDLNLNLDGAVPPNDAPAPSSATPEAPYETPAPPGSANSATYALPSSSSVRGSQDALTSVPTPLLTDPTSPMREHPNAFPPPAVSVGGASASAIAFPEGSADAQDPAGTLASAPSASAATSATLPEDLIDFDDDEDILPFQASATVD